MIMETESPIIRNFRIDDWKDLYEFLMKRRVS